MGVQWLKWEKLQEWVHEGIELWIFFSLEHWQPKILENKK